MPMVQWELNSSYRKRLGCSPYKALFRRKTTSLLTSLRGDYAEVIDVMPNDSKRRQEMGGDPDDSIDKLRKTIVKSVETLRAESSCQNSRCTLPNLSVIYIVMVERV